jgi:hypothetical protein
MGNTDNGCGVINDGPQHFVVKAAYHAMDLWTKDGTAPPEGDPMKVNATETAIARDSLGNALGGIRTPAVDVPIAMLSGEVATLNLSCLLNGHMEPFTKAQLQRLYPTHQDYVDKVRASARATREARFILPEEEATIVNAAMAAAIP